MSAQKLAVPAFFGVNADWGRIEAAGTGVLIVVPDESFPALTDDGLAAARAQFDRCRAAGQLVLGYVPTQDGARSADEVKNEVDGWYGPYSGHLDGIFFDEGPQFDDATRNYYEDLGSFVKTQHQGTVFLNAAQFPNEWVMGAADYVILWEATLYPYQHQYYALGPGGNGVGVPDWWVNPAYRDRIVHTVLGCFTATTMRRVVTAARKRNAGVVYVFDRKIARYDRLPTYWSAEVKAVTAP